MDGRMEIWIDGRIAFLAHARRRECAGPLAEIPLGVLWALYARRLACTALLGPIPDHARSHLGPFPLGPSRVGPFPLRPISIVTCFVLIRIPEIVARYAELRPVVRLHLFGATYNCGYGATCNCVYISNENGRIAAR